MVELRENNARINSPVLRRCGLILGSVFAAAAFFSAMGLGNPKTSDSAPRENQAEFQEVMPAAVKFVPVKPDKEKEALYYKAFDRGDKLTGFVFKASGRGYSSEIQILAGMFTDGKLCAVKILSLQETPGLGMRVAEKEFTGQFAHQDSADLSGVSAIAGASVSSRAVINAVMKKAQEIKALVENGK